MSDNVLHFVEWCKRYQSRLSVETASDLKWDTAATNPFGHLVLEQPDGLMGTLTYWQSGSADWNIVHPDRDDILDRTDDLNPRDFDKAFEVFTRWFDLREDLN